MWEAGTKTPLMLGGGEGRGLFLSSKMGGSFLKKSA